MRLSWDDVWQGRFFPWNPSGAFLGTYLGAMPDVLRGPLGGKAGNSRFRRVRVSVRVRYFVYSRFFCTNNTSLPAGPTGG